VVIGEHVMKRKCKGTNHGPHDHDAMIVESTTFGTYLQILHGFVDQMSNLLFHGPKSIHIASSRNLCNLLFSLNHKLSFCISAIISVALSY